ncbi:hypothetical protein FRAAL2229 [Frankia alni ACN14a]|uniref:Uncharacterized protein n=1 Tax=Frankia alni (strain DSM 45986 / CECT 9034 / ACN14a) TaxID=326424 RepID=Q0RNK9_FRAAA|nr:hypothetical protein FRAAL2229 [Frankia alni ACN14a]
MAPGRPPAPSPGSAPRAPAGRPGQATRRRPTRAEAECVWTIRRGDVRAHRRWAIRTFALTYAAVTLRLWMFVMSAVQIGAGTDPEVAFDRAYHVVPFLCWVPNLLVAQWLLTRPDPTPTARPR